MDHVEVMRLFREIEKAGVRLSIARTEWGPTSQGGSRVWVHDHITDRMYCFAELSPFLRGFPDFPSADAVEPGRARDPYARELSSEMVWSEVLSICDHAQAKPEWEMREVSQGSDGYYRVTVTHDTGRVRPACDMSGHEELGDECSCRLRHYHIGSYEEFVEVWRGAEALALYAGCAV